MNSCKFQIEQRRRPEKVGNKSKEEIQVNLECEGVINKEEELEVVL